MEMNLNDFKSLDTTDKKLDKLFEVHIEHDRDIKDIKTFVGMNGNGSGNRNGRDCIFLKIGKNTSVKIPISKGTLKVVGCASLFFLLLAGQINVSSPLVQDVLRFFFGG